MTNTTHNTQIQAVTDTELEKIDGGWCGNDIRPFPIPVPPTPDPWRFVSNGLNQATFGAIQMQLIFR